jgi:uncharacterized membrane-anchored protein YjiN (DUF445 family)
MTTFTEDRHQQHLLDELLLALNRLMTDPAALDAIRQKIRAEHPALLNLYRADRFLLKKIATSAFTFLEEVRTDGNHPLRNEFGRFVSTFIERIASSPEYAHKLERSSATCSLTGASLTSRRAYGSAFAALSNRAFAIRTQCFMRTCAGF